jgi:hypothetical protein
VFRLRYANTWRIVLGVSLSFTRASFISLTLLRHSQETEHPLFGSYYTKYKTLQLQLQLCDMWVLKGLRGTPMYPLFFSAMGAKMGKRVYVNCPAPTDYDILEIGDHTNLSAGSALIAHARERGVFEFKSIRIGANCNIGTGTVILSGVNVLEKVELFPFTLAMAGEVFPKGSKWQGSPAEMCKRQAKGARVRSVALCQMNQDIILGECILQDAMRPALVASRAECALIDSVFLFELEMKRTERTMYRKVFLTGATGFYGAFLLNHLVHTPGVEKIYCLVRDATVTAGAQRLQKAMLSYHIPRCSFRRVKVVLGDLSLPLFGLSQKKFLELANSVHAIIHNGALVSAVEPYRKMAANVEGTKTCLQLSVTGRTLKPLHYVSTISVFGHDKLSLDENMNPTDLSQLEDGYSQSKYVAEKTILLARERGFPVNVYRYAACAFVCGFAWRSKRARARGCTVSGWAG